jgi:hypothetical protein
VFLVPSVAAASVAAGTTQVDGDIDSDDEEEDTGMGDINVDAPLTMEV